DLLTSLADKSLVLYEETEGHGRYHLLETVRQYSQERLAEREGRTQMEARHLRYFLLLAERAAPELQGAEQKAWLDRLETEHNNLRAALAFSLEPEREREHASPSQSPLPDEAELRLAGALWRFWFTRGYVSEGLRHLQAALSLPQSQGRTEPRAKALN